MSDTLYFECNPCAFFDIEEKIECNDDGTVTVNFTIINTSGRTVTDFYLQPQNTNIVFDTAFFSKTILDGNTYSSSFIVKTEDGSPLSAGTVIDFKVALFDSTEWCCHMEGLSFEIPDCRRIDISSKDEESDASFAFDPIRSQMDAPQTASLNLKLLPNPTRDITRLDISEEGDYQIFVRDEYGRILHQQSRTVAPGDYPRIDVSPYPSGILLIQILGENGQMISNVFS